MGTMQGTVNIEDFIKYLKDKDLIIAPRKYVEQEQLKEKILRKKWITLKEIADSQIWDVKSKAAVKAIVKEEVDKDSIDTRKRTHKIHRSEVERIALNRNTI